MNVSRARTTTSVLTVVAIAAITMTLEASCAHSVSSETPADPLLAGPDAGNPAALTACISTDCPAPWATCPGTDGLCTTNTQNDVDHCGSCSTSCPMPQPSFHSTSVCSGGKCLYACDPLYADCNHSAVDGCEVSTADDPKNCGGCGNVCKAGDICWKGACGCPNGFTACETECKNLQADSLNCGTCGHVCVAPPSDDPAWTCGASIQPPNTEWACVTGACKIDCKPLFGDCNANICSDGCEVDERTDPKNCGACGHACSANQDCVDGTCICPAGTTRCGNRCVDTDVDVDNCGACDNGCPGAEDDHGTPSCTGGRCGYLCFAGFADCNDRLVDGCEVDIGGDPRHCGGCNAHCDTAQRQPCVLGQCLTKPCGPIQGTK